jgi:hypothetical protein
MAQESTSGPDRTRIDELVLTRVGDDAVIRPLDGVTMSEVKRVVEAERSRNRRVVVWTGTLLLAVFLFFLVIFLLVGIFVMRTREETSTSLADLRSRAAMQTAALGSMSNRVGVLESVQVDLSRLVEQVESTEITRARELDGVLADLERVRLALEAQNAERTQRQALVDESIKVASDSTQQEFERIRTELERVLGSLAAGSAGSTAPLSTPLGELGMPWVADTNGVTGPDRQLEEVELTAGGLEKAGVFALPEEEPFNPGTDRREIVVVEFPNGDRYEGELEHGVMHGWGIYTALNRDRYDGQFRDGMKEGRGTLVYGSGDKYIGEFRMDMRAGRGSWFLVDGGRYTGEFANDMPSGKGTMRYANGNNYAGDFSAGNRHGRGILRFTNGDIYRGDFREDQRTGQGTYVFADGSSYVGDFLDGRRQGQGRYRYGSGEEYVGEFRDGLRQGVGLSIFPNGKQIKGLWEGDKLVRHLPP